MDINSIKSQFPIFNKKIKDKALVYLDSSNSSQKPTSVLNSLDYFYRNEFSNIGRSIHSLAVNATNKFEETRTSVKNFINANSKDEIVFTKNATESINLVASTFGQENIKKGDEILITELEHHSNYVPWHYLRKTKGAVIKFAPINDSLLSVCEVIFGDTFNFFEITFNNSWEAFNLTGSISCKAISMFLNASTDNKSVTIFLVNTALPAPIIVNFINIFLLFIPTKTFIAG